MNTPNPTPKRPPLVPTSVKVIVTIVLLVVIACVLSIRRVTKAAFAPVEFQQAKAIAENFTHRHLAQRR